MGLPENDERHRKHGAMVLRRARAILGNEQAATNAWLFNFRRLTVRCENDIERFTAFVQLAYLLIALRRF